MEAGDILGQGRRAGGASTAGARASGTEG
jgi:hypothetical protein